MKKFTKKTVAAMLSLAMSAGLIAINASAATNTTFTDVNSDHWAYETVNLMVQEGVISGYDDGTFRPNDPVTLQEFVALALRAVNWPTDRDIAEAYETKEETNASIYRCDDWARPYIEALVLRADPYDPNQSSAFLFPAMPLDSSVTSYTDAFTHPTDPVPRWVAFEILTEAALYNGSELGNNKAYDAKPSEFLDADEDERDAKWGYDLVFEVNYCIMHSTSLCREQGICRTASEHGLIALERTTDVRHPGQTIVSANPYGTLTRAEAATLIARLKHPERRIYNAEISPETTAYYVNILNGMGIQPTIEYETPMASSDYIIEQDGPSKETYEKMERAFFMNDPNWMDIIFEDTKAQ